MEHKRKTTVRKSGKNSITINFSEKDGKQIAKNIRKGGKLSDILRLRD